MAYVKLKASKAVRIAMDGFDVKTEYRNSFPWNCGYFDGATVWGDCWCMYPKTLIWSWAVGENPFKNRTTNTYFYADKMYRSDGSVIKTAANPSGLGDWGGDHIMSLCDGGGSSDFSNIVPAEVMLIKGRHMAMYIGEYTLNNKKYNSVEFNLISGVGNGQIAFWIDSSGNKYAYKGGPYMSKFDLHGKLSKWIDYTEETSSDGISDTTTAKEIDAAKNVKDLITYLPAITYGSNGDIVKALQTSLNRMGYYFGTIDGDAGNMTVYAIKAFQSAYGLYVDGSFGPISWTKLLVKN